MPKPKKPKLKQMLRDLRSEDPKVRAQAATRLGESGDPRAVEPLIAALADAEAGVRYRAAFALGDLRAKAAAGPLTELLVKDPVWFVRSCAALALEKIRGSKALDGLLAGLHDPEPLVRATVCTVLSNRRRKRALPALVSCLQDAEGQVRFAAALALSRYGDTQGTEVLHEALKEDDEAVRFDAAYALTVLGDNEGREHLARLLQEADLINWDRKAAERALRKAER